MSVIGIIWFLDFDLKSPGWTLFIWSQSVMEKPQRRAHPGTHSDYAGCLGHPRLPVEVENFHGLIVQYPYSLIKRDVFLNVITCSRVSWGPTVADFQEAHISLPKHIWHHPVHIPGVNGRHWPKSKEKQKSSKTSFLCNIRGLWMICLDSPTLEFLQTGLES